MNAHTGQREIEVDGTTLTVSPYGGITATGFDVFAPEIGHCGQVFYDNHYPDRSMAHRVIVGRAHRRGTFDEMVALVYRRARTYHAPAPKPGSVAALASGCNCPRVANRLGAGADEHGRFFINPDCPIHAEVLRCA